MQCGLQDLFAVLVHRFTGGVAHSFTGSAEDCDKLLTFSNMYIGEFSCTFCNCDIYFPFNSVKNVSSFLILHIYVYIYLVSNIKLL